jgi:hypothetical protein
MRRDARREACAKVRLTSPSLKVRLIVLGVSRLMLAATSAGRHKVFAVNYYHQEKFRPLQQYVPIVHLYKADRVKERLFLPFFYNTFLAMGDNTIAVV